MSSDIDIDFMDRKQALAGLPHVAARLDDGKRHPSGIYFQDIPIDPLDGIATWDAKTAEEKGYFTVDFLNNSIYRGVRNEVHLVDLLTREPPWHRFAEPATAEKIAHLRNNVDIVQAINPQNIYDLAVCLALIRGSKRHLVHKPRAEIEREIWLKPADPKQMYFKRAHAVAYAASLVVQLNLLIEQNDV